MRPTTPCWWWPATSSRRRCKALAEKTYGKVPRGPDLPPRIRPVEPEQNTKRTVTLTDARVGVPSFSTQWVVPSYHTAKPGEAEALDLLAEILGGGNRSRLYQQLVVKQGIAAAGRRLLPGHACSTPPISPSMARRAVTPSLPMSRRRSTPRSPASPRTASPPTNWKRPRTVTSASMIFARDKQDDMANIYGATLATGGNVRDVAGMAGPHPQGHRRRGQGRRRPLSQSRPFDDRLSAAADTGGELM